VEYIINFKERNKTKSKDLDTKAVPKHCHLFSL